MFWGVGDNWLHIYIYDDGETMVHKCTMGSLWWMSYLWVDYYGPDFFCHHGAKNCQAQKTLNCHQLHNNQLIN
jgi:hypothetical protein